MFSLPMRKSNRLSDYDYSKKGVYFITISVKDKKRVLAEKCATDNGSFGILHLTDIGVIVDQRIRGISKHYHSVFVDAYVIMPDHLHLLISIDKAGDQSISWNVNQLKGNVTKQIGKQIWEKSFYDHVITNYYDYEKHFDYIVDNPYKWEEKENNKAGGR